MSFALRGVAARCGGGRRTWGEQQRAVAVSNPRMQSVECDIGSAGDRYRVHKKIVIKGKRKLQVIE